MTETPNARGVAAAAEDAELQLSFLPNETLVWQQGPTIGAGRFGQVMLALRIPSAEFLAVKHIYIQEELEQGNDTSSLCMQRVLPLARIEREVDIVQSVRHPNVVHFHGCERYGPVYRIFMEYIPAGSLSKLLKELGPFSESAARHFVRQLTEGVAYLHRAGVAHRDLKCANLLLTDDGTVKIADFGSAKCVANNAAGKEHGEGDEEFRNEHQTARSVREGLGSPYWMAPELVRAERGEDGWRKADVWGIGCVMVELVTGKPPWDNHSNPLTAMFHIASKDAIPPVPSALSERARAFLLCCFDKNPATRPAAVELLTHPFLTGTLNEWTSSQSESTALVRDVDDPIAKDNAVDEPQSEVPAQQSPTRQRSASHSSSESVDAPSSSSPSVGSDDGSAPEDQTAAAYSSDDEESGLDDDAPSPRPATATEIKAAVASRRPSAAAFTWTEIGRVRALADYTASDSNELSLKEGEVLVVAGVNEFGWWRGRHVDSESASPWQRPSEIGWFPCTYVEWLPGDAPFAVITPHPVLGDAFAAVGDQLALNVLDAVDVVHCEWRDDRLWAFGLVAADGRQGWFPFDCVVDATGM